MPERRAAGNAARQNGRKLRESAASQTWRRAENVANGDSRVTRKAHSTRDCKEAPAQAPGEAAARRPEERKGFRRSQLLDAGGCAAAQNNMERLDTQPTEAKYEPREPACNQIAVHSKAKPSGAETARNIG